MASVMLGSILASTAALYLVAKPQREAAAV